MMNIPEIIYSDWVLLILALLLDLIIGDPEYKYHPIRLIGNLIYKTENVFRKIFSNQKLNGIVFWFFIVSFTGSAGYLLSYIHPVFSLFIIYSCLSLKDLGVKAKIVKKNLDEKNIKQARYELSMIVGRETDKLDESEISRATIETVSENIVDGILSPVFFFALGGAPLMIAYKAINTLDSMVGYKNEKYKLFGYFSAKMDDLFNFIPARLSYIFVSLGGFFLGQNLRQGIKIGLRDGQNNPSPNSGISEAIVAGLMGIQLGGTNYYHGKKVLKPTIGERIFDINKDMILTSVRIAYSASIFFIITTTLIIKLLS